MEKKMQAMTINNLHRLLAAAALTILPAVSHADEIRTMKYFPEGRDIVCLNGEGRYTRALYGTHTRFRLETSDRPVFAVYDKQNSWNIRLFLTFKGRTLCLDETSWCKAGYQGGRRTYTLGDESWGSGSLNIYTMASFFEEGAIWRFTAEGFDGPVELSVRRCRIASTEFSRDGDLGMDPRENFEPSEAETDLETKSWEAGGETYLVYSHEGGAGKLSVLDAAEGRPVFNKEEEARLDLVTKVEINTPDPFLNTLGANMLAAADGTWDGETFLHGAIGWRTPLAGWRGAYVGDVAGWNDRAKSHFITYTKSMVTDVPPTLPQPQQDSANNMAASLKQWGTPIYSNGYICRRPGHTDEMSHYDMNLNYVDALLRHVSYDADPEFLRYIWPYLKLHHEWEKRNFDADNDHLYDAFCCIWASDALYYNGGAVTHSSAYNYRGNLLTARIAEIIGEDPEPYRKEAEAIRKAMNERLWLDDLGYWAEYQDYMGQKRLHKSAAIWSVYIPIDCGVGTAEQEYLATCYVDRSIPHIPVRYKYDESAETLGLELPKPEKDLFTVSTTDWLPYVWSTNNVAHAEVANMALAYLQAGRSDSGFKLLKADILDEMYLGACPGNFGQISYYDKAKTEAYRDFADNVGVTSRAVVNGLFGIQPDALNGQCIICQAFPEEWEEASIKTPYLSYSFRREGHYDIYRITQNFTQPLRIVVRTNAGGGAYLDTEGDSAATQTIVVDRRKLPEPLRHKTIASEKDKSRSARYITAMGLDDISRNAAARTRTVDISRWFNASADDIFKNEYLSPRPPFTSLELPKQGAGDWCTPHVHPEIEDDGLRAAAKDGIFDTGLGVKFLTPAEGHNIIYTSLWDNYPDSVAVELDGKARYAYLLMAGSTQNMQSRIDNGRVTVRYTDGSCDVMPLENPVNWCPIQQDYYTDEHAFWVAAKKPYRVMFSDGKVSRSVEADFYAAAENGAGPGLDAVKKTDRGIPSGAAQILKMPLNAGKTLESLTITTLSNDVVIGLMAVTLEK